MTLHLAGGRTVEITRKGGGFYVQQVTMNGATLAGTWLPLAKLSVGKTEIQFTTDLQPNTKRGTAVADRPPSFR